MNNIVIHKFLNKLHKMSSERGEINMIAIVALAIVVIAIVTIFRGQLSGLVVRIFSNISRQADSV